MDIDWIFFDWGGTLAQVASQDERLRAGAARAARVLAPGREDCAQALIEAVLGAESAAARDPMLREADLNRCLADWARTIEPISDQQLAAALDALSEAWIGSLEVLPGIPAALETLRARGLPMGLVSNCMVPVAYCRREFERLGLAAFMDFTVFSSQVGYRKPSPHIYAHAVSLAFGNPDAADLRRVLFVGDSPEFDVIAPGSMGMRTALVTCQRGIWPREAYERARPDLRIDSVSELPALLRKSRKVKKLKSRN